MKALLLFLSVVFWFHQGVSQKGFERGEKYLSISQYDSAIYYFNRALQTQSTGNQKALTFIMLGKTYQLNRQYDSALVYLNKGIDLSSSNNDINGIVYGKISLAELFRHLGKFEKAEENISNVEKIIDRQDVSERNKAYYYNRKAAILAENGGTPEEIIEYSGKAIKLSQKINAKNIEASSLNQLAFLFTDMHDEKALDYYYKSLQIFEQLNDIRAQANVIINITRYFHNTKDYEKCLFYCNKGIDLIKDTDWHLERKSLYYYKYHTLNYIGRCNEALEAFDVFDKSQLAHLYEVQKRNMQELETKYNVKQKQEQIAHEKRLKTLAIKEANNKTMQRNMFSFATFVLFVLLSIIFYLYFKSKKINDLLNHSVKEKELLLKEVNHRVKNNMQMVASLLELQSDHVLDQTARKTLKEGINRINALSYAHQQLYKNEDYSHVYIKEYIQKIVNELIGKTDITAEVNIAPKFKMQIEKAQALGFIVNELIANSIKYAWDASFSGKEKKISIQIKEDNEHIVFIYTDNGKGFPEDYSKRQHTSLGSTLVHSFVERQLRGEAKMYNQQGAVVEIIFKKENVI